ncbi:PEP-CTERM protein-sorting domain-containing protein [Nitrosospira multiformis]|uniref:PEP-CTERM protein-sorting domain-containing protein n=1 Tax=Nitrosospira multiformis TaxID=1231 RepID=A0A1H8MD81_9PROT|nr:polysaccharide lyase [Nitrosospira multiformis]SEO15220.1 PEP-CTERM protein-sorting domain-containing protein [Nitrosospira multiformis]
MIRITALVLYFALTFPFSFAYADIVFDGRLSKGDFSGYRALEANGTLFGGALAPKGIPSRLEQVRDPAGSGQLVMRATHVHGDLPTHGGYRSELSTFQDPVGSERWYSWGYYLPKAFATAKNDVAITQIHNTVDIGESNRRYPTLAVVVQDERIKLMNAFDYDKITSPAGTQAIAGVNYERRELASWDIHPGRWTFLDLHVKWAADNTGFLEFWKDGTLLFQEKNHINTFNDERGVWFKSGLYDWSPSPEPVSTYFSGVIIRDDDKVMFQSMSLVPESSISLNPLLRWSVEQDLSDRIGDILARRVVPARDILAHRVAQAGENLGHGHDETLHNVILGDGKEMFQSMSMSLVPEPNIYLMMLVGVAAIGFFTYTRRTISLTESRVPA